jgi:hypothetical protein
MERSREDAALYVVFSGEAGRLVQMRGHQPPLALCANPHGPRDPTQSVCCSPVASRLDFRRSDEKDGAQGNSQHGDLGEGSALFQVRLACGCPLTILDNGAACRLAWLSEAFAVEEPRAIGVGGPRGSLVPGMGYSQGLAHQRQVGIFGTNDASGVESWSRYGAALHDAHYLINDAVLTP